MDKAVNDATLKQAGTIYQYLIALRDCFDLNDNDTLQIETNGDVSIINNTGGLFQKEVKHHFADKSLSYRDIDFWNLAGRAGRLSKEMSGNIICVRAFDKENRWKNPQKGRNGTEGVHTARADRKHFSGYSGSGTGKMLPESILLLKTGKCPCCSGRCAGI